MRKAWLLSNSYITGPRFVSDLSVLGSMVRGISYGHQVCCQYTTLMDSSEQYSIIYNGKSFCLQGGEEHGSLKLSQLKRTDTGYTYTENASKNRAGGLRFESKVVGIVANDEAGEHCHCYLVDLYISRLPEKVKSQDLFYVRPMDTPTLQNWYTSVPIGRNSLAKMIPEMSKEAGIDGNKTNHSLRATGATELYSAGVPEKIIQERITRQPSNI